MSENVINNEVMRVIEDLKSRGVLITAKLVADKSIDRLLALKDSFNAKLLSHEALTQRARSVLRKALSPPDSHSDDSQITLFEKELQDHYSVKRVIDNDAVDAYVPRYLLTLAERRILESRFLKISTSYSMHGELLRAETDELVEQGIFAEVV